MIRRTYSSDLLKSKDGFWREQKSGGQSAFFAAPTKKGEKIKQGAILHFM
jgi:hypothetical protein